MNSKELDINVLIEVFKSRIAQLEYDLIVATALLEQQNRKSEETSSTQRITVPEL